MHKSIVVCSTRRMLSQKSSRLLSHLLISFLLLCGD